jgi:hypothetical protein
MSYPEQVRKQIEAAEKSFENTGDAVDAVVPTEESNPENNPAPVGETPPTDKPPVVADPEENSLDKVPDEEPGENFEEKYRKSHQRNKVLEGMMKKRLGESQAEIDALKNTIAELRGREVESSEVDALKEEVSTLKTQLADNKAKPITKNEAIEALREEWGDQITEILASFENRMSGFEHKATEEDLAKQRARQRVSTLRTMLKSDNIDFDELNNDQGFIAWLSYTDPKIGKSQQELLNDALRSDQFDRAAAFFREYHETTHASQSFIAKRPDLNEHVTKPTAPATDEPGAEAVQWTPAMISQFYKELAKARAANNSAEIKRLEAMEGQIYAS